MNKFVSLILIKRFFKAVCCLYFIKYRFKYYKHYDLTLFNRDLYLYLFKNFNLIQNLITSYQPKMNINN